MNERPSRGRLRGRAVPETLRWGVGLALVAALISGVSIFVNSLAVRQLPDPAVYTTLKNGAAALLLVFLAAVTIRPADLRSLRRSDWAGLLAVGILGGGVPFILFFTGLAQASAPSAAYIQKTMFVWVAILAVPFLGERLGWWQLAALATLFGGQFLIAAPAGVRWGSGETMIAVATLLWSIEVVVARRLLRSIPASVLAAGRLAIGLVVLVVFVTASGHLSTFATLSATQLSWGLGTGLLLSAYVTTWFAALRRAPATIVTSVLVLGAPITAVLPTIANGTVPRPTILAGETLIVGAALAIVVLALRRRALEPNVAAV
jgi:drug/metabolite transporter (DMT)-like permease